MDQDHSIASELATVVKVLRSRLGLVMTSRDKRLLQWQLRQFGSVKLLY